ncbi:MAG: nucleotidyltransferase domain-containing protein [Chlamydiae bacterium]|nr:nucleotidyltransferase domain-containing protein [Chlamydiota bacterium]
MKYGLEDSTIEKICSVLNQFASISKAVLYGSRAKGNYKKGSDIDMCLFGKDIDQLLIYRIEESLDDLLLPYQFDLSAYSSLSNKDLIDHIDRIGVVFYQR